MVTTHEATEDIPSMAEKSSRTFAEPAGFPCDFAFGALGFDHFFFWGAQSCRMLLAFVRMRMPYDACCADFVCSVKKCKQPNMFHLVLLSFPELRPWTSKYCRKQTRWIHGQSAPQLFATWLSLALLKWRRTQKSLYGVAFPEFPELQGQKPIV